MNDNFHRIRNKTANWSGDRPAQAAGTETYSRVTYVALAALRDDLSDDAVQAALETPWPETMSAPDQVRAMLKAAINRVLEVDHGPR